MTAAVVVVVLVVMRGAVGFGVTLMGSVAAVVGAGVVVVTCVVNEGIGVVR